MRKKWVEIILKEVNDYQKVLHWYEKFGYKFYYYYLKIRDFLTGKQTLTHVVYIINTQCTLQCKECHTYMPYFTKEMQHMDSFEAFKMVIDKLLKSVDLLPNFRFQGGEPLLVKDLAKMIDYACSKKQIQHIQIISNGTIIPSEKLIKAMQNPKVLLSLSDYSINDDIVNRLKYDKILKLCNENNVNAKFWITQKDTLWVGRNAICNNEIFDKELAIKNLSACHCFNNPKVIMLFRGKLYICPPAVYFIASNPDFNVPEGEVIDIINTPQRLLTRQVKKFESKKYFYLCGRCNAAENVDVRHKPGIQVKKSETLVAVERERERE